MEFLPLQFEAPGSVIRGSKVLLGSTQTVAGGITGCSMGLLVLLGVSQQLLLVLGRRVNGGVKHPTHLDRFSGLIIPILV